MVELSTDAEKLAEQAQKLRGFSGINLSHIKWQLAELLKLIGRDGFFSTYTLHDIGHLDEMLAMLDWLVPQATKDHMSPADWLLVVLSIYFHDVGMIVTEHEYNNRDSTPSSISRQKS